MSIPPKGLQIPVNITKEVTYDNKNLETFKESFYLDCDSFVCQLDKSKNFDLLIYKILNSLQGKKDIRKIVITDWKSIVFIILFVIFVLYLLIVIPPWELRKHYLLLLNK